MLENTDIRLKGLYEYVDEGYIVMILKVKDIFEYYVRDNADHYSFEFMFGVDGLSFSMCEVAIEQFKEAYENDSEVH